MSLENNVVALRERGYTGAVLPERPRLAISWVLRNEGGYVWNPRDPGGETKYGVCARTYPWLDIAALTMEQAVAIYYRDWWRRRELSLDGINSLPLAVEILDAAVNCGRGRGAQFAQTAFNLLRKPWLQPALKVDGWLGPESQRVINEHCVRYGAAMLHAVDFWQADHYRGLIESDDNHGDRFSEFVNGWFASRVGCFVEMQDLGRAA